MHAAVIVAALGYFVDVFDILLFSILRVPSLTDLGMDEAQTFEYGMYILHLQLIGLLVGGVVWGSWGDKFGRLSVLYGSIFLYSIANLACAFVHDPEWYAWYRAIAGFGLAGELGAGITLVSELLPAEKRGWGTTIVTAVGLFGAIVAGVLAEYVSWRACYFIGALLGFALLFARVKVGEGDAFQEIKNRTDIRKGNLIHLFSKWERVKRYLWCILLGFPIISVVYICATFAPEIGRSLSAAMTLSAGRAVICSYIGISVGDFFFGALSQVLKSRKKALTASIISCILVVLFGLLYPPQSDTSFYIYVGILGFGTANWALLLSTAAEIFGTNLRATVTTSIPNVIRGSAALFVVLFSELKLSAFTPWNAALTSVGVAVLCASIAVGYVRETYGTHLGFIED